MEIPSWIHFFDYVSGEILNHNEYVWRGQSDENWKLLPTLDRILQDRGKPNNEKARTQHLDRFKYAARGRRGSAPAPLETANDWWALGQHSFLATPLLDWTRSPFVAAYFANSTPDDERTKRVVYALDEESVLMKYNELLDVGSIHDAVELIRPLSDANTRLVNQAGLFTKAPPGMDIESWVKKHFRGEQENIFLLKLVLPGNETMATLKTLNRMNINHLTLFPDLYGASLFCNMSLTIDKY